ncbi:MAG: polysaccharide pyruvyl transferase family protein, partial [Hyphomicrobium sp.]
MKIAHFGGFDAANYGDQLFPLIFARRLASHADVVHVSPTGSAPPWADSAGSVSIDVLRRSSVNIDAIVIGGGNLIYTGVTLLAGYDDGDLGANLAYPSLWLGAAEMAAERGIPLVWNAPGVRREFSPTGAELVSFAVSVSDFVAVRDASSRDFLRAAGVDSAIECVVDSGIDVGTLWSATALDEAYRAVFSSRGLDVPHRAIAVHINERYVTESFVSLARRLDRIVRTLDATPILLALGPCHGDELFQSKVAEQMATMPVIVGAGARLIDYASCIARAHAYAGSSLHGMITACAFGKPAVVVAVEAPTSFRKFSGFLQHVGDLGQLCSTWTGAEERLRQYVTLGETAWPRWDDARVRSAANWERLVATCSTPLSRARRSEKAAEIVRIRGRFTLQHERLGVAAGALIDQARDAVRLMRDRALRQLVVRGQPSVDVVVCVHNALGQVRACFESLLRTSQIDFRVIIVNDGSNADTTSYLRTLSAAHPRWLLRENAVALRYTAAANQALSASTADYVVLLNSDTIVPHDWLSKLIDCGEASINIGLIGPLSNAAGWLSLPV